MVRRFIILFTAVLFSHQVAWCQSGAQLKLPQDLSPAHYQSGKVWVKLKGSARDVLQSAKQGRIAMGNIDVLQITPLLNQKSYQKNLGRVAPRKQHVDISLYYGITFSDNKALEEVMQELYRTGYFEIVEPVYNAEAQLIVDDPNQDQQYYLDLIRAEEAWDITTGDPSIVIGIVDTGGDLNHPDLQDKLYIDPEEPIDGLDNDGDGFIDNDRGWDFSGDDESLIGTPGFVGDNDPSVYTGGVFTHGTMVAGCAAASTNNGIGVAGIGYNAKLLFTKHFADNQPTSGTNYSSNLYEGVLYVATHGAKIINCSWGSYYRSTIAQDIIDYVTLDLGCLVIAAAGNSNLETPIYPAGYRNVLSVASSDAADARSMFSNYGETVDIIAPGSNIHTTTYDDGYGTDSGTSLSAPLVSGAAALVWTQNPSFTPLQVAEQLRVSADDIIYDNSPSYAFKLGKGRLDVYQALTVQSPSIRASNQQFVKDNGGVPESGESGKLYFDFTNYLQPTSGLTVTLSSASPFITITTGQIDLGSVAENSTVRNATMPFEVMLSPTFPIDQPVDALLTFSDGPYEDFQLVHFILPSYIDIDENNIITSLTPSGRIGFGNTPDQSAGSGFIYDEESLLFEMGLVMGSSSMSIYSNVRGINGEFDDDFFPAAKLAKRTPGGRSYAEVTGAIQNDADIASATLSIEYQSLVWANDPYRNFIILEYKIKNTTMIPVTDFYFGIFADWDIASAGAGDRADWVSETNLGYVYPAQSSLLPRSGIQALSGNAQYYAIDNDPNVAGNPFGLYDGFTDDEKFQSLSSGLTKTQAGTALNGGDVSQVVASGPFMIDAGEQITVAFALHAAGNDDELFTSAKYADSVYNYTLLAPAPIIDTADVCVGNSVSLMASGAQSFNWYRDFTGGTPIFSGPTFDMPGPTSDTAFFVANAEQSYESLRTRAQVIVHQTPEIIILGGLEICEGGLIDLSVDTADEYLWSNGESTQDVSIGSSGQYSVTATYGSAMCESNSVDVVIYPKPDAEFLTSTQILHRDELISFTSDDENITSWLWDFGDGGISLDQNPEYTFSEEGEYTVTLAVTSDDGCHNSSSMTFGIVTGIEDMNGSSVKAFPNPVAANAVYLEGPENVTVELELLSAGGQIIRKATMTGGTIMDVSNVANGIYILKLVTSRDVITRKLIIAR